MDLGRYHRGLLRRLEERVPLKDSSCARCVAEEGAVWRSLVPARELRWAREGEAGAYPEALLRYLPAAGDEKGLLTLEDAWVQAPDGWVFSASGRRVLDLSGFHTLQAYAPRVRLPFFRWGAQRLRGRTLSLLSCWSSQNFYHFLFDSLSRLHLCRLAGLDLQEFDQILVPGFVSASATRLLEASGLTRARLRVVGAAERGLFRADELVCPSFPGQRRTCSAESVKYLAGLRTLSAPQGAGRRLYVRRRSYARNLSNEDQVWECLRAQGFEACDPGRLDDAEQVFHEASCVVGPHGAGLVNLAFCRPGTAVLELLPSDQSYPHYYSLCAHAGLRYAALLCESQGTVPRPLEKTYHSNFDFTVSLSALEQALRQAPFSP